jgi:hypothetical protein
MRKIPKKNYLYVAILSIFTIMLTFYLVNLYNNNTDKRISFVSEIKENELKSYTTETHEAIIYMSSKNNKSIEQFENDLEKYTLENNLEDKYVYLDLSLVNNNFYNEFYINYINESDIGNFKIIEPTIVLIKNGKVISYKNNLNNIEEIDAFFEDNEVLE